MFLGQQPPVTLSIRAEDSRSSGEDILSPGAAHVLINSLAKPSETPSPPMAVPSFLFLEDGAATGAGSSLVSTTSFFPRRFASFWKMAYRNAWSTRGGGRPKYGEGDLGPPVKFCRVRGLGKLHGLMVKLTEWLAQLGSDWRELAMVAEARVVMAGRGPASTRGRALRSMGARTGVNRACQPRSNTSNRCFCPSSNADWAQIFANLGKIAMKDLFP